MSVCVTKDTTMQKATQRKRVKIFINLIPELLPVLFYFFVTLLCSTIIKNKIKVNSTKVTNFH